MTVSALEERVTDRVELVALDLIDPAKDNPRRQVGDVAELAQSIRALGLLEPLVVTPRDDRYLLVCGARRHAACVVAGLDATTCVIREFTEAERQEAMLIENLQRVDLSVLEEATSYSRLVELGHTQRQLAERVGRSQAHISKRLGLLDLPKDVLKELDSGGITLEDAQQLGKLIDYPTRLREAFKRRHEYGGLAKQVETQLAAEQLAARIEREEAAIKEEGIALLQLKTDRSQYHPDAPKGTAIVEADSWTQGVHMQPAKHAKLACHALAVHPRTGERVPLCRDPKSHGSKGAARREQETTKSKRWREQEKALRGSREGRRAAAAKLLEKNALGPSVPTTLIVGALLARAEAEAQKVACLLLGIEPKAVKRGGYSYTSHHDALVELAEDPKEILRVGLALALATDEIRLSTSPWQQPWHNNRAKAYYALLKSGASYTPTAAETLELAGKGPRP